MNRRQKGQIQRKSSTVNGELRSLIDQSIEQDDVALFLTVCTAVLNKTEQEFDLSSEVSTWVKELRKIEKLLSNVKALMIDKEVWTEKNLEVVSRIADVETWMAEIELLADDLEEPMINRSDIEQTSKKIREMSRVYEGSLEVHRHAIHLVEESGYDRFITYFEKSFDHKMEEAQEWLINCKYNQMLHRGSEILLSCMFLMRIVKAVLIPQLQATSKRSWVKDVSKEEIDMLKRLRLTNIQIDDELRDRRFDSAF